MKKDLKRLKKLNLHRETLTVLTPKEIGQAVGGLAKPTDSRSCPTSECLTC